MNVIPKLIVVCSIVFVGTLLLSPVDKAQRERMKTIADAQIAVDERLKDPDSAKYEIEYESLYTVCGTVNAKNSFGAYGGPRRFVYSAGVVIIQEVSPEIFDKYVWQKFCVIAKS